jgi:AGZA family xanthine/uracil permease-like MFS transporter
VGPPKLHAKAESLVPQKLDLRMIERLFHVTASGSTIRTEILAGLTTFVTMAYIIFVQPTVLSAAGMDFGAVLVATCVASGFATLLMAFLANYPIAVAPAMGHNFFFAYTVVGLMNVPWQIALGGVAVAGLIFILTAGVGLRERVITAIPDALKRAVAVGIGLLISLVGLEWAGIIVSAPGTYVTLGNLRSRPTLVALAGILVAAILVARRVRGALLGGMLASAAVGLAAGVIRFQGVVSPPPSIAPTFLQLDVLGAFQVAMIPVVIVFFFLALFDSIGTLVGVAGQAGLMRDGRLPRARGALLADAIGTVAGAGLGTSTVTAYIESAAGVSAGGRTGLANVVTAALFFLSLFFYPLVRMIGGGVTVGAATLYPVIAPALLLVGAMMIREVRHIEWEDPTDGIPAFLTIVIMPLAVSITDGIAFGFIAYAVLKLAAGRGREVDWLVYLFAALFLLRYAWL